MKKLFRIAAALISAIVLIMAFAACKQDTLEDYFNIPSVRSQIDEAAEKQSDEYGTMKVYVENKSKLVYEYQFKIETSISPEDVNEELSDSYYENIYIPIAEGLREEVGDNNITVIVRYKDVNGNLLGEREFIPS